MSFERALQVIESCRNQIMLNNKIEVEKSEIKAILLDALSLMESKVESQKNRLIAGERWNNFNELPTKKTKNRGD